MILRRRVVFIRRNSLKLGNPARFALRSQRDSLRALVCLEAGTGKRVWETNTVTDLKSGASIHLTPTDGAVFLFTDKGELIRAELTPHGCRETGRSHLIKPTSPFWHPKVRVDSASLCEPSCHRPQRRGTGLRLTGGEAITGRRSSTGRERSVVLRRTCGRRVGEVAQLGTLKAALL